MPLQIVIYEILDIRHKGYVYSYMVHFTTEIYTGLFHKNFLN